MNFEQWKTYVDTLNIEPLFVTVSGSHIYGFSSPDSDVDLRGCHQLPLSEIVGLNLPEQTLDRTSILDGVEVDIVSHEVGKYLRLLVKNNGYVLEQIFSPMVVTGQAFLNTLKPIASQCITRFHYHHYRGFYMTQRKMMEKESVKKAKTLLYAYRVLLTGIHLMNTGRVESDVRQLCEIESLSFIPELIAQKVEEQTKLGDLDWDFHASELDRLAAKMEIAFERSNLPSERNSAAVNELLVRLRLS